MRNSFWGKKIKFADFGRILEERGETKNTGPPAKREDRHFKEGIGGKLTGGYAGGILGGAFHHSATAVIDFDGCLGAVFLPAFQGAGFG